MNQQVVEKPGYQVLLLFSALFFFGMSLANAPVLLWVSLLPLLGWQITQWKHIEYKFSMVAVMLAYAAWAYLSLVWTPETDETLKFLKREVMIPFVIFILFFNCYHKRLWTFIFGGSLLGLVALVLLTVNHYKLHVAWFQWADHYFPGVGDTSTFMVLLIPTFILWLHLSAKVSSKLLAVLGIIGIVYTGYMTLNRMIWPAIAVSLFIYTSLSLWYTESPWIKKMKWPFLLTGLVLFILVASFAAFTAKNHVQKHEDAVEHVANVMESDARWPIWGYWTRLISQKPIVGYGYGRDVALRHANVKMTAKEKIYVRPGFHGHNIFLNQLSQLGVIGLILFVFMFWVLGKQYVRGLNGKETKIYAIIGLTLMAGYFAKNMTDDFYTRQNLYYFWAMNGVLLRAIFHAREVADARAVGAE
jgi:O-antigen ligase